MKQTQQHVRNSRSRAALLTILLSIGLAGVVRADDTQAKPAARRLSPVSTVKYHTEKIRNLDIFYREAGPRNAPTVLLLHGFPTSSHMFRDLIPILAEDYHVIAPDFPGFGLSSAPSVRDFEYTFDNIATVVDELLTKIGVERFTVYLMDYGAPVGFRLFARNPERVDGFIVQNGNAYEEGLRDFWNPLRDYWNDRNNKTAENELRKFLTIDGTKWQFTHGTREPDAISPDNWLVTQPLLDRPGNVDVQLQLFYDYGSNPGRYPAWQELFRKHQPPTLIVWGKHDYIFPSDGAFPYLRDLPNAELHLLDTGHFALEEDHDRIGALILNFLDTQPVRNENANDDSN